MKADLPTEEDVLAALLLRWLASQERSRKPTADVSFLWGIPAAVNAIIGYSWDCSPIEAAIADSERRLEVERARDAVVEAVEIGISKMPPAVGRARTRYVLALAGLAEVSRHGG